jgi:hypothetical protein
MSKYSANNSRLALDAFTFIVIVLGIISIILTSISINLFSIVLSAIISSLTIYFSIKFYRDKAFDITFSENEITIKFRHKSDKRVYSYNEIESIEYRSGGGRSINIFIFRKDNSLYKYKTNAIESGDEYVDFITHVKTLNHNFKTYIWPKSNSLHDKIRRALLNVD